LIEGVAEGGPRRFEANRVYVGDVVGDYVHSGLVYAEP
jgi:hypothetical protein